MISKKCEFDYKGRRFYILEDDTNHYWGIPSEYFIGKYLAKEFNGVTGHRSESFTECLEKLRHEVDADILISKGVPRLVAVVSVVMNMSLNDAYDYCNRYDYPL